MGIIEQIINALMMGTLYALMAVGLSLIFGVLKLVNFAHGEALMIGGYIFYFLATSFLVKNMGMPLPIILLATIPFLYLTGIIIEKYFIRDAFQRKMARFEEYVILMTFMLSIFMQNLVLPIFGPYNRQPPTIYEGYIQIGGLIISGERIIAAVFALIIITVFLLFLYKTYLGKGLRAVAQNPDSAAVTGIDVAKMRTMAFGIGICLSGLAGALLGPVFLVSPTMGISFAIKAFVIVVIGGMGSIKGSIIAAYLLAMVESLGSLFFLDPSRAMAYREAYGLLLLILILSIRPQGLFGELERRA